MKQEEEKKAFSHRTAKEKRKKFVRYAHKDRREILEELHHAVIYIKDAEMLELVHQTIEKNVQMSDADFAQEGFELEE